MRRRWPSTIDREGCCRTGSYSQIAMHQAYGGVVPELASRDHVRGCCRWCGRRWRPPIRTRVHRRRGLYRGPGPDRRPAGRRRLRPQLWPTPGASPPSASIIWRAICWRRCSRPSPRRFRSSRCWSRAAIRNWSMCAGLGRYRILGRDAGRCGG